MYGVFVAFQYGVLGPFVICVSCFLCHSVLSVPCSRVVTCWERAGLLAFLCVKFSCDFCHFPIWCPGSGVVLDCINSSSLLPQSDAGHGSCSQW